MNIQFCGIVHSHPAGQTTLSTADKQYIQTVLDALPFVAEKLYFPIVIPFSQLIPYSISKNTGLIQMEDLEIV